MQIATLTVLLSLVSLVTANPATLVVCPAEFQSELQKWMDYRVAQGHAIQVRAPASSAGQQLAEIHQVASSSNLRNILLIGDVLPRQPNSARPSGVPTGTAIAKVNVRWGSEPRIATDSFYADFDEDGIPDAAIGRIPVDSSQQLRRVLQKIMRYESGRRDTPDQQRIQVVAGARGISPVADAVIEAAARRLITDLVPAEFSVSLDRPISERKRGMARTSSRNRIHSQLRRQALAWIYLGHGHVDALDMLVTDDGPQALLSVGDLAVHPLLEPQGANPLAVLLACYTGAFDAGSDCLAEALLVQAGGPVAVIAATRVTMPYGNTVFGYELLQSCFSHRYRTWGEVVLEAKRRLITSRADDSMRQSLDDLARGLMPPPVDLATERREHAQMYHLLGDPLLRVSLPNAAEDAAAAVIVGLPRTEVTK